MAQADPVILYEKQLTYVGAVLNRHPSYLDALTEEDRRLFGEYFLPDWETEGHLYRYYKKLLAQDSQFMVHADRLLRRFMVANELRDQPELHPIASADKGSG
jgi:hypothetical protein